MLDAYQPTQATINPHNYLNSPPGILPGTTSHGARSPFFVDTADTAYLLRMPDNLAHLSGSAPGSGSLQAKEAVTNSASESGAAVDEPSLCPEQADLVDLILRGHNVFYTGSAGVSTFALRDRLALSSTRYYLGYGIEDSISQG